MTGEPIRYEPTLDVRALTKEPPVSDHNDPNNSSVKPSIQTLEGKIAAGVTLLTSLSAAVGVIVAAYPNNKEVQIAALVIAVLMAALGAYVSKSHSADRASVKQTANVVAGGLALADKAIAIAKENPELARELLKSAGVSVPTPPASS